MATEELKEPDDDFAKYWPEAPTNICLNFLLDYDTVYLSSLEDRQIRYFFQNYRHLIPVFPLCKENLETALWGPKSLLVYKTDCLPGKNKLNIDKFRSTLVDIEIKNLARSFYISQDFACIEEKDVHDLTKIIYLFDQNYQTIVVTDDNGLHKGQIMRSSFKTDFPGKSYRIYDNLCIPYNDNEEVLKLQSCCMCYKTAREEVPIIRNGYCVEVGVKGDRSGCNGHKDIQKIQPFYWHMIDDEVAKEFFGDKKKILLSSAAPGLLEFKDRFNELLDFTIFNESLLTAYFAGEYDMLIYGGDIWEAGNVESHSLECLYVGLLTETIVRLLKKNNVPIYILSIRPPINNHNRNQSENYKYRCGARKRNPDFTGDGSRIPNGKHGDCYYSTDCCNETVNVYNGIRFTDGVPSAYRHTVHTFGVCTNTGNWAKDEETIDSYLQARLNESNLPYRVVNHTSPGWDHFRMINGLYHVLDTSIYEDDIVIILTLSATGSAIGWREPEGYRYVDFHWQTKNRQKNYFTDSWNHLLPEGNKAYAEAVFDLIKPHLNAKIDSSEKKPIIFPERPYRSNAAPELTAYLNEIKKYRRPTGTAGAIVMNANPFTKGHLYLIEEARKQVDQLFVFIVEEDLSDFSFADRFAIAKANCSQMANVAVLPSGKYMISLHTFAEYFSKDALQEKTIFPANDVNTFGRHIAPALSITKRFAGSEPLDKVTRQYNETMRDILPSYGLEFIEMPRLTGSDGEVVNATKVRRLIREGKFEACRDLLTEATYRYIEDNLARITMRLKENQV